MYQRKGKRKGEGNAAQKERKKKLTYIAAQVDQTIDEKIKKQE
jgi:hypothetical protein